MTKKKLLIKKGSPLPSNPNFKFDSAHTSTKKAEKRVEELLEKPKTDTVRTFTVPRQKAIFVKTRRISPRRPRISR